MADSQITLQRLEIRLLGAFEVTVDGHVVGDERWERKRAQALLKLLALQPEHRLHREQVVDLLWPDAGLEDGLRALHKSVHHVRRALEPDLPPRADSRFLATNGPLLELRAPDGVFVDAVEFESLAERAIASRDLELADRALELHQGELLPSDLYDEWTVERRARVRDLRRRLLIATADLVANEGDVARVVGLLSVATREEPTDESAHRALMRAQVAAGDVAGALRQYEVCRNALRRELDVEPDADTEALRLELLERRGRPSPPEPSINPEVAASRIAGPESRSPLGRRFRAIAAGATGFAVVAALAIPGAPWTDYLRTRLARAAAEGPMGASHDPAAPLVSLMGRASAPGIRVELLDTPSGWGAFAGLSGEFVLRDAQWTPGAIYELVLTAPDGAEAVVQAPALGEPDADGRVWIGTVAPNRGRPLGAVDETRRRAASVVDFDDANLGYYQGVFDAVTNGLVADREILDALNAFVASKYTASGYPIDVESPRRTLEVGSGFSGHLCVAMATLVRAGGYDVRIVEVSGEGGSGVAHRLVEVLYDGSWHLYDPAYGVRIPKADGTVASLRELHAEPGLVRQDLFDGIERLGWDDDAVRRLYTTGVHHYLVFRVGSGGRNVRRGGPRPF